MQLSPRTVFEQLVQARVDERTRVWLTDVCRRAHGPRARQALLGAYTGAARRLGREPLGLSDDEAAALQALDPDLSLAQWTTGDLGRALLLLAADAGAGDSFDSTELLIEVYDQGDNSEQRSWLLTLPLLGASERFRHLAVDSCRTNILSLFEAIACENPFPARAFPELHFNQLVLKALFHSIPLTRIVGLERRANAELARMAHAYASERRAAGRPVPADIGLVSAAAPSRSELFR